VSKEEIIAATRECAEKLGHVPSFPELQTTMKVTKRAMRTQFGTYGALLKACGMERHGPGHEVNISDLFLDWAGVVRRTGKIPSINEYGIAGRYSIRPLLRCFHGWRFVPLGMMEYARKEQLEAEWADVINVIARHLGPGQSDGRRCMRRGGTDVRAKMLVGQPVYGAPMLHPVMSHAPTNEQGVLILFGAEAQRLGFKILRTQTECPDCEAMRSIGPDRWQRVRIEFEQDSRNFLAHGHSLDSCDLIVCWNHNWQNCPLEVLELRSVVEGAEDREN